MQEMNLGNAQHRASLALKIAQFLSTVDSGIEDESGEGDQKRLKRAIEVIQEFAQPVDVEEQEQNGMYIIDCAMTRIISFIVI